MPGNNIDQVIYREICYVWQYTLGFNWILLITVYLETCQLIMNIFSCEWCNFGSIVTDNLAKGMLFPFLLPQQSLFI